jgi:uncharacterized protein (TIGR00299 family) protein
MCIEPLNDNRHPNPPSLTEVHHIHLDAVGGVAGDMFVAAMLDALPGLKERVLADVAAVLPPGCGEVRLDRGMSGGLAVLRFGLAAVGHEHAHHHGHAHSHHHSPVAHFPDMVRHIAAAALHPGTAEQATAILTRLAGAESRIHGVPIEKVHFHEIADWDSVMDVVAAGSIAAALANAMWSVSSLPLGSGQVRTAHGLLPVPAPATTEILKGFRCRDDGIAGERVTPTGAAILAHLVTGDETVGAGLMVASGTGAGTRELVGAPNVLRALVFAAMDMDVAPDEVVVLSFDIDDMTGEEIGIAAERLRAADGVLDLTIGNRLGKKSRPVCDFRLLVRPDRLPVVSRLCLLETSTIGLRWRRERRQCLPRTAEWLVVEGREMQRKRTLRPGGQASLKVESDELAPFDGLVGRRRMMRRAEHDAD